MQNRLKIRVWDKFEKTYWSQSTIEHNIHWLMNPEEYKDANYPPDCVKIEQCTGLKDKNGKLIYEGDIVRSNVYPFMSDDIYNYSAEICWSDESAQFFYYMFKNKDSKVAGRSTGNTGSLDECEWEVIGNIHEENKDE